MVKVLDRVGQRAAEHGQYLKRHIVYINGQGSEWLEDPKHLACDHQKPVPRWTRSHRVPQVAKTSGKAIPEALDEVEGVEGKLYQQGTGISTYVSSGRFDIQFCVKRLSEMMTRPRKLGNRRLARLARYLVGTEKLVLRFDHHEYGDTVRIALRFGWKRGTLFHACRAGIPWRTSRGFVGCIRSSASIEFRRSRAVRNRGRLGTSFTKHMYEEMGRTINIDVETVSTAAIGMCSRTLERPDIVRLRKVKGTDNEADMGTKDFDGPTHQRLLQKLPSADGSWA